jgi:SAM-dependent methyltransferase
MERARPFYAQASLQTELYDAMTASVPGGDDVAFFTALCKQHPGRVLELGCGTGRIAAPLARAGHEVVGIDLSRAMLATAERRRRELPPEVRDRLTYVRADMSRFELPGRFSVVFAAYRSFMSLCEPEDQRRCLALVRRHLRPGGVFVVDVFDPLLDRFTPSPRPPAELPVVRHPTTGNTVRVFSLGRTNDPVHQRLTDRTRYIEVDAADVALREEVLSLTLRWTYRFELRNLLELAGLTFLSEISDYAGAPPAYGKEIIITAERPGAARRRRRVANAR